MVENGRMEPNYISQAEICICYKATHLPDLLSRASYMLNFVFGGYKQSQNCIQKLPTKRTKQKLRHTKAKIEKRLQIGEGLQIITD